MDVVLLCYDDDEFGSKEANRCVYMRARAKYPRESPDRSKLPAAVGVVIQENRQAHAHRIE